MVGQAWADGAAGVDDGWAGIQCLEALGGQAWVAGVQQHPTHTHNTLTHILVYVRGGFKVPGGGKKGVGLNDSLFLFMLLFFIFLCLYSLFFYVLIPYFLVFFLLFSYDTKKYSSPKELYMERTEGRGDNDKEYNIN